MDHFKIDRLQVDKNRNGPDPQKPHNEDELYYVLSGSGVIEVGEEKKVASPGSLVFVPADKQHKITTVKEKLKVLVIFSPPEDTSS